MRKLDDKLATETAALLNVAVTPADAARMAFLAAPQIALIAGLHLPFDSEPSNLARNLARGAPKAGAK
jgi:hypothetical protein